MKFFYRIEVEELMYAYGQIVLHLAPCHLVPGGVVLHCCGKNGCDGCNKDVIQSTDQVCFLCSLTIQQI